MKEQITAIKTRTANGVYKSYAKEQDHVTAIATSVSALCELKHVMAYNKTEAEAKMRVLLDNFPSIFTVKMDKGYSFSLSNVAKVKEVIKAIVHLKLSMYNVDIDAEVKEFYNELYDLGDRLKDYFK